MLIRTALLMAMVATTPCSLAQDSRNDIAIEGVRRLVDVFRNCQFSAVITSDDVRVRDYDYRSTIKVAAWVCPDAVLVRLNRDFTVSDNGKSIASKLGLPSDQQSELQEWRWSVGGPWLRCGVRVTDPSRWPGNERGVEVAQIDGPALAFPDDYRGWINVWTDKLVGEFIHGLDVDPGITFEELVTDGGRLGFSRQTVSDEARDDASSRTEHFRSALYGACDVTLSQIGGSWMPTRFVLVRTGEDRVTAPDPATGRCQSSIDGESIRLPDLPLGRKKAEPSLDRLETVYTITYDPLPTGIEKTEVQFYRGQQYTSSWKLRFLALRCGNVDTSAVNAAALPLQDGMRVLTTDQPNNRIRSELRGGKVVRATDVTSINIAESARFSTSRKIALLTTSIIVAALAILLLYRRALRG
jgi:hypothetical protein